MNFLKEFRLWKTAFLRSVPGKTGILLRSRYGRFKIGKGSRILQNVTIYYPENLSLGCNTRITPECQLNARGGISIGSDVLIGPGTFIWSQNHKFADSNCLVREQGYEIKPVVIEDDVWIAARCVILPGVTLAKGTVVAAGAVVAESTTSYSVVAGVPAKVIRKREALTYHDT